MSGIIIEEGLLSRAGSVLKGILGACSAAIVSDDRVAPLYLERLKASLEAAGFPLCAFTFPAGEASKNAATYLQLLDFLAGQHLTRTDAVIALGGGVVSDLAGFAAATYLRGVKLVQVPTSLLACVDAAIGGKTGIDLPAGKNLAGAFWQPQAVLIDPLLLSTLPPDAFCDGMAEVIKYAFIGESPLPALLAAPHMDLPGVIRACVDIKEAIVGRDALDRGERQLLNFGHTFGHAVEKCSNYRISHGCAVAIGMSIMARACLRRGLCGEETCQGLLALLRRHGLPTQTSFSADELSLPVRQDKKRAGSTLTLVILDSRGKAVLLPVDLEEAFRFLKEGLPA
ncbi:MAG: 3-dehydroquinate synthase [Christensenellales bacterium]